MDRQARKYQRGDDRFVFVLSLIWRFQGNAVIKLFAPTSVEIH